MARRMMIVGLALALVAGCGQAEPLSPTQQATLEVRRGNYAEAIKLASEALRIDPNDAEAYMIRGRAHHFRNDRVDDLNRAIEDYTRAIALAPSNPEGYYSRSLVYRDRGNEEEFRADEALARKIDPHVKGTYDPLPDLVPVPKIDLDSPPLDTTAKSEKEGEKPYVPKSGRQDYNEYLRLKRRFDPDPPKFGKSAPGGGASGAGAESTLPSLPDPTLPPSNVPAGKAAQALRGALPPGGGQSFLPGQSEPLTPPAQGGRRRDLPPLVSNPFAQPGNSASPWQMPAPQPTGQVAQPLGQPFSQPPTANRPLYTSPFQGPSYSPFQQSGGPRPTGYVPPLISPIGPQLRQFYSPPPVQTMHPIEAYQSDFNP